MNFENFEQVISYLENFTNLEKKTSMYNVRTYRLDRMRALLDLIGNPQNSYKIIHIAGSKGKGSTASFIASAISALGFKCGLYMSPHVSDYRERFTLAGKFIDDETLVKVANSLAKMLSGFCFSEDVGENSPTTFELYTAFAFMLFKECGCTWAVVETGLGGRLDATNVVNPVASVITPIELEHTDILGDTIEKIAVEKSKIIKQNTLSFTSLQQDEALDVFRKEAKEKNSVLCELSDMIISLNTNTEIEGQKLNLKLDDSYSAELKLKMIGDVQAYNCALAIVVLRALGLYKTGVTEKALENNIIPGRMEKLPFERPLYIDGAHTGQSMSHLLSSFRQLYSGGVCIFGSVAGKNHELMAEEILGSFDKVIISRPGTFKKSDPEALYRLFLEKKTTQQVFLEEDALKALEKAKAITKEGEPVLCCGSFYIAGVIKEALCL